MARSLIGRSVRRLRQERGLTQVALATRLGISASYLNLIEHDQRAVTVSLLIKLSRILDVDLETLSGNEEHGFVLALREALTDPQLGNDPIGEEALTAIAAHPAAARAILSLSRAWATAREDASAMVLPSGRRLRLPREEARALFNEHGNHFPALELAAERLRGEMALAMGTPEDVISQSEINHAIAERLRRHHGVVVRVAPMADELRHYDPAARLLVLSDLLKRESRGFHMAFQLMLIEAGTTVEQMLEEAAPSSIEAGSLIRIGLINYAAAALLMPYTPFLQEAVAARYDVELLATRFAVSFEQAAQRLSTLQRPGERGVPFFFLRIDAASNITKAFSGAGFPFTQSGGSCPIWVANTAFAQPGRVNVQIGQLPDLTTYLCFAQVLSGPVTRWNEPSPRYVVALGCEIGHAPEVTYADGLDIGRAVTPIGVACRLCDWTNYRSRAFAPLNHRLSLDINRRAASPVFLDQNRAAKG